jgi:hypothetical protein
MQKDTTVPLDSVSVRYSTLPYVLYLLTFSGMTITACLLTPSSTGYGTHQQLGLPPCGFLTLTGYPCPSCGITTSLAYLLHGDVVHSLVSQPFGTVFYAAMLFAASISLISIWRRIPAAEILSADSIERIQYGLLLIFFLSWFYKIYLMKVMPQ